MLDNIRCEDYGFKLQDLTVAVMVKSYLRWMSPEDAKETLNNIVSSHETKYKLDGMELARLINDAKTAASDDGYCCVAGTGGRAPSGARNSVFAK